MDQFPTPVDKIIQYTELKFQGNIDVSRIPKNSIYKVTNNLLRSLEKIRGAFDFREKLIYLDLSQSPTRKNFVKLHETAHGVLPWQTGTHNVLGDDDHTLSSETNEEFEQEANFFASLTLFQHDRFDDEISKLSLSIETSMYLAKHFGASIHATLRRYVESSKKRCALLVLENVSQENNLRTCALRNVFYSQKFLNEVGFLPLEIPLSRTYGFVLDYYSKRKFKLDGVVNFIIDGITEGFNYHFFYNGYNAFVFIFPKGEKQSSRTKIIISETAR